MGKSAFIAALVVVALVLWMLSGQLGSEESNDNAQTSSEQDKPATLMKVQTQVITAENITREVIVQGQLEPLKVITVRAETAGNVKQLPANKGERIRRGQLLASMSIETRNADLAVARANLIQASSEYEAIRKLQKQGLQSKSSLETASAQREAARAQLTAAELALASVDITAPIDALVEDVAVKQGDFLERGTTIATLIDNTQLLVTARIPQQRIADIKTGQKALAKLVTGQEIEGSVNYISTMADSARSFLVEVLIAQPPAGTMSGISTQLSIPVETIKAHRISPAVLSLDDNGTLGVKAVGADNTVVFHAITVVKTETNGAWVTGLPNPITLITLGQGFVNPGEEIEPVPFDNNQSANDPQYHYTPAEGTRVAKQ